MPLDDEDAGSVANTVPRTCAGPLAKRAGFRFGPASIRMPNLLGIAADIIRQPTVNRQRADFACESVQVDEAKPKRTLRSVRESLGILDDRHLPVKRIASMASIEMNEHFPARRNGRIDCTRPPYRRSPVRGALSILVAYNTLNRRALPLYMGRACSNTCGIIRSDAQDARR